MLSNCMRRLRNTYFTHEKALDAKTHLMLFEMVDSDLLNEISWCVSTGRRQWSNMLKEESE